jgi:hypothetical protein
VDPEVCTCCWNRLLALPDQSLALLYRDSEPHDMRLSRLPSGGTAWRDQGPVGISGWHFSGCPHCGGGLAATGRAGKAVLHGLTWTGKDNTAGLYYSRSGDYGRHWSSPFFLGDSRHKESDIAARASGEVAIVYTHATSLGSPLYWLHSRDQGRHWSKPSALTAPDAKADHPRVIATDKGFRAFWTESREGGGKSWTMAVPSL